MLLKEDARSIHEIIALLHLVASRELSPEAIHYAPPNERTVYVDGSVDIYIDASDKVRGMIFGKVVGHRGARLNSVF